MFWIILLVVTFLVWKWFSADTRVIIKGTVNRSGEDTLLACNKGLDLVEESLDLSPEYKAELLQRYNDSKPTQIKTRSK